MGSMSMFYSIHGSVLPMQSTGRPNRRDRKGTGKVRLSESGKYKTLVVLYKTLVQQISK